MIHTKHEDIYVIDVIDKESRKKISLTDTSEHSLSMVGKDINAGSQSFRFLKYLISFSKMIEFHFFWCYS